MSMKKTDLEKIKGKKIAGSGPGIPDRFGRGSGEAMDRRERRERDREAGLVPFAVKLHSDLVRDIRARAEARGATLDETAAELLTRALKEG
jgi:hypothetical protein